MSKYHGYPYVTKIVNDVPTIDSATASQWAHLPRKPIQPPLPRPSGSGAGSSRDNVSSPTPSESRPPTAQKKPNDDDNPVVYIDLPSPDESDICTSIQTPSIEPEYVQNTFLYDPFDNKRIDVSRREEAASSSSNSASNDKNSPTSSPPRQPTPASSSRGPYDAQPSGSRPTPPQSLPGFMEKESLIYGGHGANEFPLSPIPISEFPEPPPAYTEVAPPKSTPQPPTPAPEPPRTQVILPSQEPINPSEILHYNPNNRKFLRCQHCNSNVHTMVIKQNGTVTYIIAILLFVIFMPLVFFVFCSDCLKENTHYCPNCNKRIGFEVPVVGSNIHFEKPSNSSY